MMLLYGDRVLRPDQFFFLPLHLFFIDKIYTKQFSFLLMFLVLIFVVSFFLSHKFFFKLKFFFAGGEIRDVDLRHENYR